ncbi:MAG: aminotransferase class V-fold PLP-dependent enzyme [bacterium]|nr:aminotransferase class V-fold PLP-dependent enzyme [bacterium]
MTTATELRRLFLLRDDVVFLNHGSFGACPRPVFDVYQALQRELEAEPVDFLARERDLPARLAAARARLAAFVGADRDEIVFVPNTTTGLNIVARSLDLHPGDEILTTDHEYGAMDRTWTFVGGKTGAKYVPRALPLPLQDPQAVVEAVWGGVSGRTRVFFVSHITSTSGVRLPVEELVARARERGIFTVVDGAHGPGQLDLDLHALGADVYVGNCHKWLMSPKGAALLYVRGDRQDLIEPLAVSWGWHDDQPGPSRFVDEQEWIGTRDVSAYLAVPAALDFFAEHDWPRVRARCRELLLEARTRLLEVVRLPALCPPDPWLLQMAVVPLPAGVDATALQLALRRDHLVEAPVTRFAGRDWLRISIHGYNTTGDVDRLVTALRAELG